jgi:hypothetical protein
VRPEVNVLCMSGQKIANIDGGKQGKASSPENLDPAAEGRRRQVHALRMSNLQRTASPSRTI